ncbi:MAG: SIMPL domain-containing protein [Gemmobacter sp.]|uniref:SIMPL domain-containing protein n=1 Tax=Gemmobacter sp. TaxID=1898957 RepID=UPI003918DD0D
MRFTTAAILAAMLAAPLAALPARAEAPAPRITVTGEGRTETAPDMATVSLGVQTRADTAAAALAENSAQLARVLARLKAAGIAERDLQTSGLGLGPQMDYSRDGQPPRVVGYEASNQLTVRVRDLSRLGAVLDQAVGDGANTLNGLSFGLSDPAAALDAARVQAVAEARRKARMMAEAAGARLGAVLEMNEQGNGLDPRPMFRTGAAMEAAAVPIAGGEVGYAVSVSVTWALLAP